MDDRTLTLFIQVCECESISKAANQNYISRQSLTQMMNGLEKETGVRLFERSHTGIALTSAGKYFLQYARERIQTCTAILDEMKAIDDSRKIIHLGCRTLLMSNIFLHDFVLEYDANKKLLIVIQDETTEDCWELLRQQRLELAYTLNPREDLKLVSLNEIGRFHGTYVLVSRRSSLANKHVLTGENLADSRAIVTIDKTSAFSTMSEYYRRAHVRPIYAPNSHTLQHQMVEDNEGILLVPGSAVPHFASANIVAKPLSDFPRIMHQHLVFNKDCDAEVVHAGEQLVQRLNDFANACDCAVDQFGNIHFR